MEPSHNSTTAILAEILAVQQKREHFIHAAATGPELALPISMPLLILLGLFFKLCQICYINGTDFSLGLLKGKKNAHRAALAEVSIRKQNKIPEQMQLCSEC